MKKSLLVLAIALLVAFVGFAEDAPAKVVPEEERAEIVAEAAKAAGVPMITGKFEYSLTSEFVPDNPETKDKNEAELKLTEGSKAEGAIKFVSADGAASVEVVVDKKKTKFDVKHASVTVDPLTVLGIEAPVDVSIKFEKDKDEVLTVTMPDLFKVALSTDIGKLEETGNKTIGIDAELLAVPGLTLKVGTDINKGYKYKIQDKWEITLTNKNNPQESVTLKTTKLDTAVDNAKEIIAGFGGESYTDVSIKKVKDEGTNTTNGFDAEVVADLVTLVGLPLDALSVGFKYDTAFKLVDKVVTAAPNWKGTLKAAVSGIDSEVTFAQDKKLGLNLSYTGIEGLTNKVKFTLDTSASSNAIALGLEAGYKLSDALSVSVSAKDVMKAQFMELKAGMKYEAGLTFAVDLLMLKNAKETKYAFNKTTYMLTSSDVPEAVKNPTLKFTVSGSF